MTWAGEEQSIDLPIDQPMIGQLALEAEIRNMRIGELLAALIIAILKRNSLEPLLQEYPKRGGPRLPYSLTRNYLNADGNDGKRA